MINPVYDIQIHDAQYMMPNTWCTIHDAQYMMVNLEHHYVMKKIGDENNSNKHVEIYKITNRGEPDYTQSN